MDTRPETRLVPDRRYTTLATVGVVAAVAAALITSAVTGRLLAAVAAVILAAYVAGDLLFSPRLIASADGIVINSPLLRSRLAWPQVEDVRADTRMRHGLRSTTLEVDAGGTLAVFSRRAIGMDPPAAADLINAHRPPG